MTWAVKGWAQLGSNQRPLVCKTSALPLSYTPFRHATPHSTEIGLGPHNRRDRQAGPSGGTVRWDPFLLLGARHPGRRVRSRAVGRPRRRPAQDTIDRGGDVSGQVAAVGASMPPARRPGAIAGTRPGACGTDGEAAVHGALDGEELRRRRRLARAADRLAEPAHQRRGATDRTVVEVSRPTTSLLTVRTHEHLLVGPHPTYPKIHSPGRIGLPGTTPITRHAGLLSCAAAQAALSSARTRR